MQISGLLRPLHPWTWIVLGLVILSLASQAVALSFDDSEYTGSDEQIAELKAFVQGKIAERSSRLASRSPPASSFQDYTLKHRDVPPQQVESARAMVSATIQQMTAYNKQRIQNPRKNNYGPRPSAQSKARDEEVPPPPVLNQTVIAAAALVAEIDAAAEAANGTLFRDWSEYGKMIGRTPSSSKRSTSSYWLPNKDHIGSWPYGSDSSFKVFRNVADYGAVGDGVTVS